MEVYVESEVVRLLMLRAEQNRKRGTPGPESTLGKVAVSPHHQRLFGMCLELLGADGMLIDHYEMVRPARVSDSILGGPGTANTQKAFLASVGGTIGGGTTEIAKNVIGERVLGLPKEPSLDRDLPWSQIPRS